MFSWEQSRSKKIVVKETLGKKFNSNQMRIGKRKENRVWVDWWALIHILHRILWAMWPIFERYHFSSSRSFWTSFSLRKGLNPKLYKWINIKYQYGRVSKKGILTFHLGSGYDRYLLSISLTCWVSYSRKTYHLVDNYHCLQRTDHWRQPPDFRTYPRAWKALVQVSMG